MCKEMIALSQFQIVFSDVDGTLLNKQQKIGEKTQYALRQLNEKGIPFVIISARSPSGIFPILLENHINCWVAAYNGALIYDPLKKERYSCGFSKKEAKAVIDFIEENQFDAVWNIFYSDCWIVKDTEDKRVKKEESIVKTQAQLGFVDDLKEDETIHKILCMCNKEQTATIVTKLKEKFLNLCVVQSSSFLIEIVSKEVNKGNAVKMVCQTLQIQLENAIAFGDNYNDYEMLTHVGYGFLMDNAPDELKKKIKNHTKNHDEDGIYYALKKLKIIH